MAPVEIAGRKTGPERKQGPYCHTDFGPGELSGEIMNGKATVMISAVSVEERRSIYLPIRQVAVA